MPQSDRSKTTVVTYAVCLGAQGIWCQKTQKKKRYLLVEPAARRQKAKCVWPENNQWRTFPALCASSMLLAANRGRTILRYIRARYVFLRVCRCPTNQIGFLQVRVIKLAKLKVDQWSKLQAWRYINPTKCRLDTTGTHSLQWNGSQEQSW